jgi:hypothetical protein
MVRALRVGVPGGMSAGAVMAVWSMAAMWIIGSGFGMTAAWRTPPPGSLFQSNRRR